MLIRYSDGRVESATLLAAGNHLIRVALPRGCAWFTRSNGQWSSSQEDGPVEIDFTAATTERDWHRFCDAVAGLDARAPWDADSLLAACIPLPAEQARTAAAHQVL